MLLLAVILFASAALGGAFMAIRILTNKNAPLAVALLHGGAGAAGLLTLLLAVLSLDEFGAAGLALTIFGANALLGFYLFSCHLRRRPWPKAAVLIHGAAAVTAFAILLFALLKASG